MAIRIQLRRDTAANWTSANPVLLAGELGIETDTLLIKVGNGNNWNDITGYANTTPSGLESSLSDYVLLEDVGVADGVASLDSSGNLLIPSSSIILEGATSNAYETTLTVVDPTADRTITLQDASGTLAHISNVNDAISTAASDATTKANDAVATAEAYTDNEIDVLHTTLTGEISTHNSDTTGVHGISDTSALATKTYADNSSSTAQSAAEATAASALSAHSLDTTNIHGIADTAALATQSYVDSADSTLESSINTTLEDYVPKAGAILTGNITVPTVYATDLNVSDTLTATTVVIDGDLTVNGTTTTVNTSDLTIADNLIYLNEALSYTVTGVTGDGTNQTYTTSSDHDITDAMVVKITGIDPSGYNKSSYVDVVSVTSNTITVAGTETGTYVSGGTIYGKADVNPDLGFVGGYNDGTYGHSGLVRDASADGLWILFEDVVTEPSSAIDFSSYTRAPLQVGALFATGAAIGDVTNTELQYVHGVTSAIQDQIDSKAALTDPHFDANILVDDNIKISNTSAIWLTDSSNPASAGSGSMLIKRSSNSGKVAINANGVDNDIAVVNNPTFTGTVTVSSSGVAFTDGTQTKQGVPSITPIISKTSNYTLSSLSERDSMIEVDSSSDVTITIPTNSAVAYPVGTSLDVMGINTGLVTIAGDSGVTVNATPGLKLRAQWSSVTLFKRGTDSWVVYGDLKA